jgi:hypothetical protein
MVDHQPHWGGIDKITRQTFLRMPGMAGGSVVFAIPMPVKHVRAADAPGQGRQLKAPKSNPQSVGTLCDSVHSAPAPCNISRRESSPI